jgi:hypothetical protein
MSIPIYPDTRVGDLLDAYPGIEEVLIRWFPAFAKLRNPILRKTVAKVATLEQAARVGGTSVRELVRKLREETGQPLDSVDDLAETTIETCGTPWTGWICQTIDVDALLESGIHPLGEVRRVAGALAKGEILRLTTSFRPAPLLEVIANAGFAVRCTETSPRRFETLIRRIS